jgi:spore coat protein SA
MSSPRVLYLTDLRPADKFGSLEEQIFVLAKAVKNNGGTLIPVFGAHVGPETAKQYESAGLLTYALDLHDFSLASLRRLISFVKIHQIELIHWNFYNPINPYLLALSTAYPKIKHYLTDHNSRIPSQKLNSGSLRKLVKQTLLKRYDRVLCISDFVKKCLTAQEVWPEPSTCTYFINTARFRPDPEVRSRFRVELGFKDPTTFLILFVGKLIAWKGVDVAIKALSKLPSNAELIVVGEGEAAEELEQLAAQIGIANRTHFLGGHRNVEPFMQSADCFLCPSIWEEAVGLVNLEAMASGLPVVASRIGGIPEYISHGTTGLLFEPGNHEQLAEQLQYLMDNPEVSRELGRAARAEVVERFSIERRVPQYVELYRNS